MAASLDFIEYVAAQATGCGDVRYNTVITAHKEQEVNMSVSKNIVLLSGSPRKDANTDKLAAAFVKGAESEGKSVTVFRAADMKIGGCLGCRHCFEEMGVCIQKDDMTQILDALKSADALVLASPVYFWGVTAQLKLAIDRTYALLSAKPPVKRAAMLLTCGSKAGAAPEMFRIMCDFSGWENAGLIIESGLHEPDAIEGRAVLAAAEKLGREI